MRRIGLDAGQPRPPQIIEAMDKLRIGGKRLGRADILNSVIFRNKIVFVGIPIRYTAF